MKQLKKTPLALAALTVVAALPAGAQASVVMEAEGMSLSSYAVESGNRIKLTSTVGTAQRGFSGSSGTYNIRVYVQPETDGQSTLELFKGNSSTAFHKYTYPLSNSATSFTVNNVTLSQGENFRLVGRQVGGAIARVDKIEFTPVATSTPTTSTPTTSTPTTSTGTTGSSTTIEAEGMTLSSYAVENGNRIKLTGTSGTATKAFAGPSGTYTMQVYVQPETDGQSTLEVFKGTSTTPIHKYTYPLSNSATSFTVNNVTLNNGENIRLLGRQVGGAIARVDKIVLTQVGASTPTSEPSSGTPTSSTIEAESMGLASYKVENGNRIMLSASSGSASKAFGGASGTYDMQVHVQPETDGQSTLEVYKGTSTTPIHKYTYPLSNTATSFTVKGVALKNGEAIKLLGRVHAGAWARVDKIVLTPSTASSPVPSEPVPSQPTGDPTACANPSSGYEGFGRNTTGGAGKSVYRVTNLKDSGAGSLRDAVSQGNRCVVFDVGGTITLSGNLLVRGANVTIDGLTAPSPGITLKSATLVVQGGSGATNVVMRGIRVRNTPEDAIRLYSTSNVVVDRVSASGFGDGAIDITEKTRNVTIQWSIIGEGNPNHNTLSLIKYDTTRVSVHHNLYVNGNDRNPDCERSDGATSLSSEVVCDVRNNVIWNYQSSGTSVRAYGTGNVINNYYYTSSTWDNGKAVWTKDGGAAYVSGNHSANGWNVNNGNRSTAFAADAPTTTDAITAAKQVVTQAGARGSRFGLDSVDQNFLSGISIK